MFIYPTTLSSGTYYKNIKTKKMHLGGGGGGEGNFLMFFFSNSPNKSNLYIF